MTPEPKFKVGQHWTDRRAIAANDWWEIVAVTNHEHDNVIARHRCGAVRAFQSNGRVDDLLDEGDMDLVTRVESPHDFTLLPPEEKRAIGDRGLILQVSGPVSVARAESEFLTPGTFCYAVYEPGIQDAITRGHGYATLKEADAAGAAWGARIGLALKGSRFVNAKEPTP